MANGKSRAAPGRPAPSVTSAAAKRAEVISTVAQATIRRAAAEAPRSRQIEMGPSEAGEECTRRLAYKLMDWPATGRDPDPWPAVQGVAVHAWLADAFRAENERLGRERYLVEQRVEPAGADDVTRLGLAGHTVVPGNLAGSCDLFDRDTGTVIDWKLTSPERLRQYAASGPGPKYRTQAHLYGSGLKNAGEHVATVSVAFLSRAASLSMHVWSEPYSSAVADDALRRLASIRDALVALDVETSPGRWGLFPTAPGSCRHCPWLKPGSRYLAAGCPGHLDDTTVASSVGSLIA